MEHFYKYHGAGNDFILFNQMEHKLELSQEQIAFLCDRNKGIGADGLMMLMPSKEYDFIMKYYNSDGKEGSMCGNGGRCILSFAYDMGIKREDYQFIASDGVHEGRILNKEGNTKTVELKMNDVSNIKVRKSFTEMNTGSPHYIKFTDKIDFMDVVKKGRGVRNSKKYIEEGINVNFVEYKNQKLKVRTYERGVENETLACGTGVTAAAIACSIEQNMKYKNYQIETLGGQLGVKFKSKNGKEFTHIFLTGPAEFVFEGRVEISKKC